jgi:hypothetical protein
MRRIIALALTFTLVGTGCAALADLGKDKYRIEWSGTPENGNFSGKYTIYTKNSSETKEVSGKLPFGKDIVLESSKSNDLSANGGLDAGGAIKVKIFRNGSLCKEFSDTDSSYAYAYATCYGS